MHDGTLPPVLPKPFEQSMLTLSAEDGHEAKIGDGGYSIVLARGEAPEADFYYLFGRN